MAVIAASVAHAAALAAIHAAAFPHDPWSEPSFATLLTQPGVHGLLDPRGGMVLLRVVADEAEILTIGVTARRQGIGRALMLAAMDAAGSAGAQKLFLEVAASNQPALAFYHALGFAAVGTRLGYYADGDDAKLLRRNL